MASKGVQETAKYYQWLIRIERQEFEEELLEIVSYEFPSTAVQSKSPSQTANKCIKFQ